MLLTVAFAAVSLPSRPVFADISFPARLGVEEKAPGDYAITFTLPTVAGRVLRAEPTLPATCSDLTKRWLTKSPQN